MRYFTSLAQLRALTIGLVALSYLITGCTDAPATKRLPHLGEAEVTAPGDTTWPTVPTFHVLNQDSVIVTPATFAGKVYLADFFFTTCPTICPGMQRQMLRVYKQYKGNTRVAFLSHTIDPDHDTLPVLREYAGRLGITSARQWHFATAPRDSIFALARQYMVAAQLDPTAPGGAVHSGAFVLVDPQHHIRGMYDGTQPAEVDRLLQELPLLLAEFSLEAPADGR
ncbi:SCO family protein [Hymenobacter sp. GOD-10R]|uniref:SCO family protein n=1 Tax=Hymenobacter sp. GOD-10R TaxID=3093922 RepID=UPI002D771E49|nr:SCO family protein [Hymenobacter sp. GOD-10R]WRQ31242.1 SCO family protein [Hymenobacter sp. GOD-10R]